MKRTMSNTKTHTMDKKRIQRLCEEFLRDEDKLTPAYAVGVARASFRLILEEVETLKPNGVSHTVYPDQPAESFNDWTANFTRQEVAREADAFKEKADKLWRDTYYRTPDEADEYKEKFDKLWDAFKKSIQNQ